MRTGSANTILDVPGLRIGHACDHDLLTGTTVLLPDEPVVAAADCRGGGIGSRDLAVLAPESTVTHVHAIALSGGSAFGLDAGGGAMRALAEQGIGFSIGTARVPIVPTAIVFDLLFGGTREWEDSPWWRLGYQACRSAMTEPALRETPLGNVGAGLGATAGPLKGGLGSASVVTDDGVTVGALAVVNALGSVTWPGSRTFHAWTLEIGDEFGGLPVPTHRPDPAADPLGPQPASDGLANTTLAVVATDAALSRNEALRVAIMAQDGLARAIRPVHAPLDGDTVFALSTARRPAPQGPAELTRLGHLAADCVARAIVRGVIAAEPLGGVPSWRKG